MAARGLFVAALAVVAARVHAAGVDPVLCPLRQLTGIPCPACGSTSAFIALGSGRPLAALAANPGTLAATAALVAAPLGAGGAWWRLGSRTRTTILAVALATAWIWQLHRFGLLPTSLP